MNNMERSLTISLSLEKAREWYTSNDYELRELALRAYSESELKDSYEEIISNEYIDTVVLDTTAQNIDNLLAIAKLNTMAWVFNKGWLKNECSSGYVIKKEYINEGKLVKPNFYVDLVLYKESNTLGMTFFRNKKDAIKAMNIGITEGWLKDIL